MGNSFHVGQSSSGLTHSSSPSSSSSFPYSYVRKRPVVVIIGGGYAGVTALKELQRSDLFDIYLIERKAFFYFSIGSERAAVDSSLIPSLCIPYSNLNNPHTTVIQGEVVDVTGGNVLLAGHPNAPIPFNFLLIATGSDNNNWPLLSPAPSVADVRSSLSELNAAIDRAQRIVIVGGGATGVQMAGEIGQDHKGKGKDVALVAAQRYLVGRKYEQSGLQRSVEQQLQRLGVRRIKGERVLVTPDCEAFIKRTNKAFIFGRQTLMTDAGTPLPADLVIFCRGGPPNIYHNWALFRSVNQPRSSPSPLPDPLFFLPNGRLSTNYYFQLRHFPHVFALGDVAGIEDRKAFNAIEHARRFAANLIAAFNKQAVLPYLPCKQPRTALTIGRRGGVIQINDKCCKEGKLLGARMTSWMKSSHLFLDKALATFAIKGGKGKEGMKRAQEEMEALFALRGERAPFFSEGVKRVCSQWKWGEKEAQALLRQVGEEYLCFLGGNERAQGTAGLLTVPTVEISKLSMNRGLSDGYDPEADALRTRATYTNEDGNPLFPDSEIALAKEKQRGREEINRELLMPPMFRDQSDPQQVNFLAEVPPAETTELGGSFSTTSSAPPSASLSSSLSPPSSEHSSSSDYVYQYSYVSPADATTSSSSPSSTPSPPLNAKRQIIASSPNKHTFIIESLSSINDAAAPSIDRSIPPSLSRSSPSASISRNSSASDGDDEEESGSPLSISVVDTVASTPLASSFSDDNIASYFQTEEERRQTSASSDESEKGNKAQNEEDERNRKEINKEVKKTAGMVNDRRVDLQHLSASASLLSGREGGEEEEEEEMNLPAFHEQTVQE